MEPVLHRAVDLRAAGYGEDDVRRLVRSGVLVPVRRGAYVERERAPDDGAARHALLLQAALAELGPGAVASHVSAAVLHGLPTWGIPPHARTTRPISRGKMMRQCPASGVSRHALQE